MRGNISKYSQTIVLTAVLIALQLVVSTLLNTIFDSSSTVEIILGILSHPISALILGWIYALVLDKRLTNSVRISVATLYSVIFLVTSMIASWSILLSGIFAMIQILLIVFLSTIFMYYLMSTCLNFMPNMIVRKKKSVVFKVSKEVVKKIEDDKAESKVAIKKQSSKTNTKKEVTKKAPAKKVAKKTSTTKKKVTKKAPAKKVATKTTGTTKKAVKKVSKTRSSKTASKKAKTKKA